MMEIKKNKQIKTSIDFNNISEKHLSIQLSLDGFSFCVINTSEKQFEKIEYLPFANSSPSPEKLLENVQGVFSRESLLQKRFGSVNITHVNQLSSLVPKSLFDEEHSRDYLKFSTKTYNNDYIVHDELENHDIVNVYIPFVNVNNFFLERFGSFEYKHFSTVLINNLLNTYKFSEHPHMFAHIGKNQFEIIVIARNKLLLYNTFSFVSKEDFIYYILFTAEQLNLNPETFELILAGLVDMDNALYKIAYKYVRKVTLIEFRSEFKFPSAVKENQKRQHFALLNQYP